MKQLKGSCTVEAAIIVPILLFLMVFVVNLGIWMHQEIKEMSKAQEEQENLDVIDSLYHLDSIKKLIGENNGD